MSIFRRNVSRTLISLIGLAACETFGAEPTNFLWSLKGESSGMLFLSGIAPDRESNCYVHGVLRGKGSLNGQSVPEETAGLPGFLAKLAPDGTVIWFKRLGFSTAMSSGLTVDADANAIVAGSFAESAKMGEETLRARGVVATVIAKFNPKGGLEWTRKLDTTAEMGLVSAEGLAADPSHGFSVAGSFSGRMNIGNTNLTSSGPLADLFVARYDADGEVFWASAAHGDGRKAIHGVVVDSRGNTLITGQFENSLQFGTIRLVSRGREDIFIAKYDSAGNFVWAKGCGGASIDDGRGIAVDAAGNCFLTGQFVEKADFAGTELTSAGQKDGDIFICKFGPGGRLVWAKAYGSSDFDDGNQIVVDERGRMYFTGHFSSHASRAFALGPFKPDKGSAFVAGCDPDGTPVWGKLLDGYGIERHPLLARDAAGNLFVGGGFDGNFRSEHARPLCLISKLGVR